VLTGLKKGEIAQQPAVLHNEEGDDLYVHC
jgi:hypothetical protein